MEVIVHDDGSDNGTLEALFNLRSLGLISTLILNQKGYNEGQGIALNRMFHAAKGDPIVKFDHDLICKPGWLRKAVEVLDANAADSAVVEPRIGALGLFHYHADHAVSSERTLMCPHATGWEQHRDFVGSAMVIPRSVWEQHGPFGERSTAFAEDYEFKMDLLQNGLALGLLPEDVVVNQGFGLGPSTVVVEDGRGGVTSRAIMERPFIIDERS